MNQKKNDNTALLTAIEKIIDRKLDEKLAASEERQDRKDEARLNEKLAPVYEFIEDAKPVFHALFGDIKDYFDQKLPQRVKRLEDIHPTGHHTS